MTGADAPAGTGRRIDLGIAVVAAATAAYFLWNLVQFRYGRDQGIYSLVADAMLRGGAPYRDAWDFKPPGIYFVYAPARFLFGDTQWAVRVLELAAYLSLFLAMPALSRRFAGGAMPGVVGAAIAVTCLCRLEFWHTAQPESFGAVLVAWGMLAGTAAATRRRRTRLACRLAAGALFSAAGLLKPPMAGCAVAAWAVGSWLAAEADPPRRARHFVAAGFAFALGAVLPVLAVVAWFVAKGAWTDLSYTLFRWTPGYTRISWRDPNLAGMAWLAFRAWFFGNGMPYTAPGIVLWAALPPLASRERAGAWLAWGTILPLLAGVVMQAKFYQYHFAPILVPGAMLAGWGFWKARRAMGDRPWAAFASGCLLWLFLYPDPFMGNAELRLAGWMNDAGVRQRITDALGSAADSSASENRRAAEWVRARTAPGSRLYIWGFEPVVYDLADRVPASRYIYNVPQRTPWDRDRNRDALMRDLEAAPPAAVLVLEGDRMPDVTGDDSDSSASLRSFPALRRYLDDSYTTAAKIGDFTGFLRRSGE